MFDSAQEHSGQHSLGKPDDRVRCQSPQFTSVLLNLSLSICKAEMFVP